ncbi:MAG: non-heme iron oxygenase ferredoxin subunit [Anaerolineaceae bacterium]|nr:non-heme iron oxygenase ferredoxin subunit [Anaerolineaceae bacterium]
MNEETRFDPIRYTYHRVALVSELPDGERLFVEIQDEHIVLFNIGGEYAAIRDVCTHDDGPLGEGDLDGCEIVCPRHGARFNVRSGKALSLPAVEDVPAYPVRVVGDTIELGMPEAQ